MEEPGTERAQAGQWDSSSVAYQGHGQWAGATAPGSASPTGPTASFARFRRAVTSVEALASGSGHDFQCETRQRPRAVGGQRPTAQT